LSAYIVHLLNKYSRIQQNALFDFEKCGEEMLKLQKLKYSTNAPHMQSGTALKIC